MLKIYGSSDDLVEIDGHITEEFDAYDVTLKMSFDDGTVANITYGKGEDLAIWRIELEARGNKFKELIECNDEDAEVYSDILVMDDGVLITVVEEV